jgi:hypothetical protein
MNGQPAQHVPVSYWLWHSVLTLIADVNNKQLKPSQLTASAHLQAIVTGSFSFGHVLNSKSLGIHQVG